MKVLVVTNMYPTSEYSFYGIFVKEQVESLRKEGILVDVFFINGKENRLNYFTSIIGLSKKIKLNHYDIIHAHYTYCIFLVSIVKSILGVKTPLILTFHEAEVHKSKNLKPFDADIIKRLVYSKKIKKIALNSVDLVISVEKGLTQILNFEGRTVVLPCGVDLNLFQPMEKMWCRKKLCFPIDKKIIFFPASLKRETHKGFDILEEALKFISRKNIRLITGGNISHKDMPYYMCAADVVVQTSNFEASPMIIKEAMACNIPIVSTDVGDTKETIGDTKGCYICERNPRDIAEKIKVTLEFNGRTKGRNRILALDLGLHQVSTRIIEIYENMIKLHEGEKSG